jgi:hypothetical protein
MTSDRNKPGVAFWATLMLVVVLVALAFVWHGISNHDAAMMGPNPIF